jgi:hypothetical protein
MNKISCMRGVIVSAVVARGALCLPAIASAAVTIGGDITASGPPINCGGDADHPAACDVAQTALAGGRATAPLDGVVVRWRVGGATGPFALRVVRPTAFTYTFVSTSVVQTPASTGVETFVARQPIRAGDDVGVELGPGSQIGAMDPAPPDDMLAGWTPMADGQSAAPVVYRTAFAVAYNADVEPDVDHDGYGDETQDDCVCPPPLPAPTPAPAATSAASTPTPDRTPAKLTASARSARLSKGGSISFLVASSEKATGVARASVRLPKLVRFVNRAITLAAGARTKVTLRLSRKDAVLVRRALVKHAKLKVLVTLAVKDSVGNPSAAKLSLSLRR